jgi:hypothetical protein
MFVSTSCPDDRDPVTVNERDRGRQTDALSVPAGFPRAHRRPEMITQAYGSAEFIHGATRSIDRLTDATDEIRSVIMREVSDRDACSAALVLVARALCVAIHAVPRPTARCD